MNRPERERRLLVRHFDQAYYRDEYPDVIAKSDALTHFCEHGWREGRNPGPFFDTVSYLLHNGDVLEADVNPYYHFLTYGMVEGRKAYQAATPSVRTNLLFGYNVVDWVDRVRPYIDEAFYAAYLPPKMRQQIDFAAHFAYRGWREGFSPNKDFDIVGSSRNYADAIRLLVNPLLIWLEDKSGLFRRRQTRQPTPIPAPEHPVEAAAQAPQATDQYIGAGSDVDAAKVDLVRGEFSTEFYLLHYPDVAKAGIDPVMHYMLEGWKEGRRPNSKFDTEYYLAANEDVAKSGLNPFWHFLAEGRREGRQPCRPGGYRRRIIDAARAPEERTSNYLAPEGELRAGADALEAIRRALVASGAGVVVALSHDCYIRSVGGVQIFIADEQVKFNAAGVAYLHISPLVPRLALAPQDDLFMVRIVLDGQFLGVCPLAELTFILSGRGKHSDLRRTLVVHSVLGFNDTAISAVRRAFDPQEAYYWLHDYSSLCAGFNLLRNDVDFCGAPSPGSMACRVCVCGPGRLAHLEEIDKIFKETQFVVLAPSQVALDLWRARSELPCQDARVHWHWQLEAAPGRARKAMNRDPERSTSIAFIGVPLPAKGWEIFSALAERYGKDPRYKFYHFVSPEHATISGVTVVPTVVSRSCRSAAIDLLRQHEIDFVLVLSTWPETFSFVTYEAMAGGAFVLCLKGSGNVAATVERIGCGRVFPTETAIQMFFEGQEAQDLVRELDKRDLSDLRVLETGTTATIVAGPGPRQSRRKKSRNSRPAVGSSA